MSVELMRRAKRDGINVTAEATPHHIALTDDALGTEVCASVGAAAAAKSKDASNVAGRKRIELSSARGGGFV